MCAFFVLALLSLAYNPLRVYSEMTVFQSHLKNLISVLLFPSLNSKIYMSILHLIVSNSLRNFVPKIICIYMVFMSQQNKVY